ncbi:hypothetical protein B0H13DRAFT_1894546 [Mycena leptocephala]|nr:hypothetical protein B0H13DRAFT_1894546 [Mycena leptocephala]
MSRAHQPTMGLCFLTRARNAAVNMVDEILTAIKKPACPVPVFNLNRMGYLYRPQATNLRLGKITSTKTFEIGTIHKKFMRIPYNLTNADPLDHKLRVANIIGSVAKFPAYMGREKKCRHAIYDFCALSGVAWDTATAATQLARIHPRDSWIIDCAHCETGPVQHVLWIYTALEELHESREEAGVVDNIGDLLQALFLHRPVQGRTTVTALRTIL